MMRSNAALLVVILAAMAGAERQQAAQPEVVTLSIPGRSSATPWVAALGSRVAVAWGATNDGKTDVFVAVSEDAGRTFAAPRQVNTIGGEARLGGELPPRVQWTPHDAQQPELVVLWTARGRATEIKIARSLDNGRTFIQQMPLQSREAVGDRGWPALALDGSGTAHAIWLDHRGLSDRQRGEAPGVHKEHEGTLMAQRSALYYAEAGPAPAAEQRITNGVCYCCKTALVAGDGGELYAAWRHVYAGSIRDIAFSVYRKGAGFASPVRVSDDGWQLNGCPDDGPAMAVDGAGTVHVVWPTVLNDPQPQGALFYSTTHDGKSFTPRVRVPTQGSPKPSHPQIAVRADGSIAIGWDEVVAGTRAAFLRHARGDGGRLEFSSATALDPGRSSMYPVMANTAEGTVVVWTAGAHGESVVRVRRF